MKIKIISILVLLLFVSTPLIVFAQQLSETQQASKEAKRDARLNVSTLGWGFGGFACGGCAVLYAYLATPQVPVNQLIGKSPAYVNTYTSVYKQHVKRKRTQYAVIGCGIAVGVSAITNLLIVPQLQTD